jgi:hypothetical protein
MLKSYVLLLSLGILSLYANAASRHVGPGTGETLFVIVCCFVMT